MIVLVNCETNTRLPIVKIKKNHKFDLIHGIELTVDLLSPEKKKLSFTLVEIKCIRVHFKQT